MKKNKLELKGNNVSRISKPKKEKMQKTLDTMQENRQIDSTMLRDLIIKKLEWAKQQKDKGLKLIEDTKIQINRIDGIILFINDLLQPSQLEKEK